MRNLAIAYGNNRQAKTWVNKTIKFDDLKERLKVTIRTTESAEEYAKMSKAQRDAAKDHGGFVAGVLKGGRRKIDTVDIRSMLALDGDRINVEFLDTYETKAMCDFVMQQDDVKMLAASEKMADAETDFSDAADDDWQKRFQYEPRSTVLKNNLHRLGCCPSFS